MWACHMIHWQAYLGRDWISSTPIHWQAYRDFTSEILALAAWAVSKTKHPERLIASVRIKGRNRFFFEFIN